MPRSITNQSAQRAIVWAISSIRKSPTRISLLTVAGLSRWRASTSPTTDCLRRHDLGQRQPLSPRDERLDLVARLWQQLWLAAHGGFGFRIPRRISRRFCAPARQVDPRPDSAPGIRPATIARSDLQRSQGTVQQPDVRRLRRPGSGFFPLHGRRRRTLLSQSEDYAAAALG